METELQKKILKNKIKIQSLVITIGCVLVCLGLVFIFVETTLSMQGIILFFLGAMLIPIGSLKVVNYKMILKYIQQQNISPNADNFSSLADFSNENTTHGTDNTYEVCEKADITIAKMATGDKQTENIITTEIYN